VFPESC